MADRLVRLKLRCSRATRVVLGVLSLLVLILVPPVSAAEFSGRYDGIGASTGMRLTLQESDSRVVGRFDSGRGDPYTLNGRRTGDAAQGSVERGDQSYYFHVERRPLGLQFLLIPRGADGGPDIAAATDYSFVQQGLQLPEASDYKAAPPRGVPVDIEDFIDGFREWSPGDMARVYVSLEDRHRELVLLFDHAAAEMLWRICTIKPPTADFSAEDLARLLDRQGTDCSTYLKAVEAARKDGLLGEFVRKANFQFELIRETVKCDRNQSPDTKCADVGAMTSPLLLRWRRAIDLMIALSGGPEAVPLASASVEAETPEAVPPAPVRMAPVADEPAIGEANEPPRAPVAPLRGSLAVGELLPASDARVPLIHPDRRAGASVVPSDAIIAAEDDVDDLDIPASQDEVKDAHILGTPAPDAPVPMSRPLRR